ncbi:MAG: UDP-N-acetylmuramate--L-alanine ligase [Bdellovibrionales bacterium]|nr:UDP-N-acetylmuramate--L-alanine ligase [Bdellovibrionales bacterium]
MYNKIHRIHLIGIGGIGVSGIAELLQIHGYTVTGSDLRESDTVRRLRSLGIQVFLGHQAENVVGAELVVYSSAVGPSNPELSYARELGLPTIRRAEMLAELMRLKHGIAVAGAHGKTTTTSMIATILLEAKLDPTIIVGGRMDNIGGTNARMGTGKFLVTEADESDGSFNKLTPSIAVVTNMDREHMEYYQTMRKLKRSFLSFLNKVPFYGLSVFNGDDPYLQLLRRRVTRRKVTFGKKPKNDYCIQQYSVTPDGTESRIRIGNGEQRLKLRVPGIHNLYNALAALAVADELAIPRSISSEALYAYTGVQRRFQEKGKRDGVLYIDDYAHHPTEIRVTLAAARERFPGAKIRAVFQPHRFSRVEDLFDEFSECFKDSDAVCVTDIYAAGESNEQGLHSELLVENMHRRGITQATYVKSPLDGVAHLSAQSQSGDVILTLGAGDIPSVYRELF